jgi:hypothetical protein
MPRRAANDSATLCAMGPEHVVSEGVATFALTSLPAFDELRPALEDFCVPGGPSVVLVVCETPGEAAPWRDVPLRWLERYPLPLVFAFETSVRGDWLAFALECDIRVCGREAVLDSRRLESLVTARRWGVLGGNHEVHVLDAPAALEAGLVSEVTEPGLAAETAGRLAATIASRGPLAVQLAKEAVWRGHELRLEQALRLETDLTLLLQSTKDRAEGVRAFLEKRPPQFTGE